MGEIGSNDSLVGEGVARGVGRSSKSASRKGVQRHLILRLRVDSFDNVDLPAAGPVLSNHPKGGPSRRTRRHGVEVDNDERSYCDLLLRGDTHRVALSTRGECGGVVNFENGRPLSVDVSEALGTGSAGIDKVYLAMSRVGVGEKVPAREKVGSGPVLDKFEWSSRGCCRSSSRRGSENSASGSGRGGSILGVGYRG